MRGQRHAPAALYPRERPGTHCTGGWVGPRAGLDRGRKSGPPTGIRSPDRPARMLVQTPVTIQRCDSLFRILILYPPFLISLAL